MQHVSTSMSVLIVRPKCSVACCPLVSHGEYASGTERRRVGRTPDCVALCFLLDLASVTSLRLCWRFMAGRHVVKHSPSNGYWTSSSDQCIWRSVVFFAVHESCTIFLSPFILKASRRVSSFFLSVQLSQPYVAAGHTSAFVSPNPERDVAVTNQEKTVYQYCQNIPCKPSQMYPDQQTFLVHYHA